MRVERRAPTLLDMEYTNANDWARRAMEAMLLRCMCRAAEYAESATELRAVAELWAL
jgi:hypothetical protein